MSDFCFYSLFFFEETIFFLQSCTNAVNKLLIELAVVTGSIVVDDPLSFIFLLFLLASFNLRGAEGGVVISSLSFFRASPTIKLVRNEHLESRLHSPDVESRARIGAAKRILFAGVWTMLHVKTRDNLCSQFNPHRESSTAITRQSFPFS